MFACYTNPCCERVRQSSRPPDELLENMYMLEAFTESPASGACGLTKMKQPEKGGREDPHVVLKPQESRKLMPQHSTVQA